MDVASYIQQVSLGIVPVLMSISLHEVAHGAVAYRLGDPTAKMAGRLTLNPIKHLDPLGLLVFLLTRIIGWAKPVPVNPFNLKNPKRDMIWVAAAGPATNLALALLCAAAFRGMIKAMPGLVGYVAAFLHWGKVPSLSGVYTVLAPITIMLFLGITINVALCIFNLIPIPPLDGGRIVYGILPMSVAQKYATLERWGLLIVLIIILAPGADRYFGYIVIKLSLLLAGG